MKIYALVSSSSCLKDIQESLSRFKRPCQFFKNIEELFVVSIEQVPQLFILHDDFAPKPIMYDLVRDLRTMFGTSPSILIVGDHESGDEIAHFLGTGVDSYLKCPLDVALFEDFLARNLKKDVFRPFKYRHIPSGGRPAQVELEININRIDSNGIHFEAKHFLSKGVVFGVDIGRLIDLDLCEVKVRVFQNSSSETGYVYFAEYYEVKEEQRKMIVHHLKHS